MVSGRPKIFVAFDLETTGLFPETDRIIEIGAVKFRANGAVVGRYEQLVCPEHPISPGAQKVHGLCDADLADAPRARDVLPAFLRWLGDPSRVLLMAHHARFDAGFLGRELLRLGGSIPAYQVADTLSLARRRLPHLASHKLTDLAQMFDLRLGDRSHRALADALRVMDLWRRLEGECESCLTYALFDPMGEEPVPSGWERLARAISRGQTVRLTYLGGTHGTRPRPITPTRFHHKGGMTYLAAFCHLDRCEKSFRLDRIVAYEVEEPVRAAL